MGQLNGIIIIIILKLQIKTFSEFLSKNLHLVAKYLTFSQ